MSVTLDKRSEAAGSKARRAFAEKSIGFRTGGATSFYSGRPVSSSRTKNRRNRYAMIFLGAVGPNAACLTPLGGDAAFCRPVSRNTCARDPRPDRTQG